MLKDLEEKLERFALLEKMVSDPKVIANNAEYRKYAKELSSLQKAVSKYKEFLSIGKEIASLETMANEPGHEEDFIKMAREELASLLARKATLQDELQDLLIEKDEDSGKNVIMEIRQGAGGIEAALFAQDLFRMYGRLAVKKNWKLEVMSSSVTEKGGIKEIVFSFTGSNVFDTLKFESGTHRVQRVPITESSGRIHTSAATVAVLPEAEDVDVEIKAQDLKIDVFRAGGRGGQHVNVTDSAVRITHLPSGLVVSCQDERSQHKNKAKAMRVLRARLMDHIKKEQQKKRSRERSVQVGSGDRSEKIRTYNFPDRRVTDHRITFTVHNLEGVLNGDLDEIIGALKDAEKAVRRKKHREG